MRKYDFISQFLEMRRFILNWYDLLRFLRAIVAFQKVPIPVLHIEQFVPMQEILKLFESYSIEISVPENEHILIAFIPF